MYGNYSSYGRGYGRQYSGYSRNYGGGGFYYQQPRQPKKHSGCKIKMMDDGAPIITAWNYSRGGGLISIYARPYKGTAVHTSKSGKEWLNLFVTIRHSRTKQETKTSGLYSKDTQKLVISSLSMVCNPRAPQGGYCGTFISRKR